MTSKKYLITLFLVSVIALMSAVTGCFSRTAESLSNPAVEKCLEDGFELEPEVKNGVPLGYRCVNPKTTESCEVWQYYRGECRLTGLLANTTVGATAQAVFAGGCFWCMESDFEKLEGVTDVISGFTGGTLPNPTYNGNHDGHFEAIQITYDPAKVSYKDLLDHYWINIDPFDATGQFCDKGSSYLSAIFVANETEKELAVQSKRKIAALFPNEKIVTPIRDASTFYPIKGNEAYHQDYYKNNPIRYNAYRWSCGRDKRLKEIWGEKALH